MFTKRFFKDLAERSVVSAFQAALVVMLLDGFSLIDKADLKTLGVAFLTGFVLAVVKAVAALPVGDEGTASFVRLK